MAERLQRLEGVNILNGEVMAECVERSHMAAGNTREQWRMLGMKFYVTQSNSPAVHPKIVFLDKDLTDN